MDNKTLTEIQALKAQMRALESDMKRLQQDVRNLQGESCKCVKGGAKKDEL